MPLVDATKNSMLTTLSTLITHASLHSAFPSTTGANETTGGSYARKAVSFSAPAAGSMDISAAQLFDVPAAATVGWIGGWSALTAGTFRGYAPNGSTGVLDFTVDATTDVVTAHAHGFANTDTITFYGDTPPGGLTEGTVYFARDVTTNTFKVAATSGGVAIDLTSVGNVKCVVSKIVVETFAGAGQVNLQSFAQSLNLA
jgi:hypothetical protein